jgi:hypothetical protein
MENEWIKWKPHRESMRFKETRINMWIKELD